MIERFPDGARVAFVGDSLTAGDGYSSHITAYYAKHFPGCGIHFYPFGLSGGTAESLIGYFDKEIKPWQPTHACIMLGTNNAGLFELTKPDNLDKYNILKNRFEKYKRDLDTLIGKLEGIGAKISLATLVPYDEYMVSEEKPYPGGFALITVYSEYIRNLAQERGYGLLDINRHLIPYTITHEIHRPDHTHLTDYGQTVLGAAFLKEQGLPVDMDEFKVPEYPEYHEDLITLLRLHAVMLWSGCAFEMTNAEKDVKVRAFLESMRDDPECYMAKMAKYYLDNISREDELRSEIARLTPTI